MSCINLKEDIELILENIDGFFVIDNNEKVIYMTERLAKRFGFIGASECIGKSVREIWEPGVNNLYQVLQTGKQQIGEVYLPEFPDERIIVSNGFPIYQEGKVIAAFEYDAFSEKQFLDSFLDKITEASAELNYLKSKYKHDQNSRYTENDIVGDSVVIRNLKKEIHKAAMNDATVMIQGETGTGKELVAHSIHNLSRRNAQKFQRINCSAIPENIFESELFGYEEGCFTGARKGGSIGKIESADGGTIFFDEISRLPLSMQPKLLRFLQEREINRLGSSKDIHVNIRTIAATNQDLHELVQKRQFREDLYYRLNVLEINVPPLRERMEDIPALVDILLVRINNKLERQTRRVERISDTAMALLQSHNWPGNVRELENTLESAVNNCYQKIMTERYFVELILKREIIEDMVIEDLQHFKNKAEENAIAKTLEHCDYNKEKAAELLNISRQTLYNKIKKYNLGD